VVHHLRKTEANDIMDMVSGSTGLTGAADNLFLNNCDRSAEVVTGVVRRQGKGVGWEA
jgi:hypothetical protein